MNTKELKGRDVLKAHLIEPDRPYDKESKMKGQKYNRYNIGGYAVAVNTTSGFNKDFLDENIYSIDLFEKPREDNPNELMYSFASYTTKTGEIKMAETDAQIRSFSQVMKTEEITEEDLAELKEES